MAHTICFGQMLLNSGSLARALAPSAASETPKAGKHLSAVMVNRVAQAEPHCSGYGFNARPGQCPARRPWRYCA